MSKITPENIRTWKGRKPRPLALTAYDYPMARLLDEVGVEILHVGDSLGMVILGFPDTTYVTMEHMLHHVAAVSRVQPRALITADLPIGSYQTPEDALIHSQRLIEAGAEAVKMEGGEEIASQISLVIASGIPVQGHLGMLPQRVREEGGYKRKGKNDWERNRLLTDALLLEKLGCFSIVIECVVTEVAQEITQKIKIPTIGIGSGYVCDGEIRVSHDLFGLFPWFQPPYVQSLDELGKKMQSAVRRLRLELEKEPSKS